VTELINLLKGFIQALIELLKLAGWELFAFVGAPFIAFRVVQWIKSWRHRYIIKCSFPFIFKSEGRMKPNSRLLDMLAASISYSIAYLSWMQKYNEPGAAILIGILVAVMGQGLIIYLFKKVENKDNDFAVMLRGEYYIPPGQEGTVIAWGTKVAFGAKQSKRADASEDRPVWNDAERVEKTRVMTKTEHEQITDRNNNA
jgi:hypothetical protein